MSMFDPTLDPLGSVTDPINPYNQYNPYDITEQGVNPNSPANQPTGAQGSEPSFVASTEYTKEHKRLTQSYKKERIKYAILIVIFIIACIVLTVIYKEVDDHVGYLVGAILSGIITFILIITAIYS